MRRVPVASPDWVLAHTPSSRPMYVSGAVTYPTRGAGFSAALRGFPLPRILFFFGVCPGVLHYFGKAGFGVVRCATLGDFSP